MDTNTHWYIGRREDEFKETTPVTTAEIQAKLKRGEIRPFDYVRQVSGGRWMLARQLETFDDSEDGDQAAVPAEASAAATNPQVTDKAHVWQALFEEIDRGIPELLGLGSVSSEVIQPAPATTELEGGQSDTQIKAPDEQVSEFRPRFFDGNSEEIGQAPRTEQSNEFDHVDLENRLEATKKTDDVGQAAVSRNDEQALAIVQNNPDETIDSAPPDKISSTTKLEAKDNAPDKAPTNSKKPRRQKSGSGSFREEQHSSRQAPQTQEASPQAAPIGKIVEYDVFDREGKIEVDGKLMEFTRDMITNFISPSKIYQSYARAEIVSGANGLELRSLEVLPNYDPATASRAKKILSYRIALEQLEKTRTEVHGTLLTAWADMSFPRASAKLAGLADEKDELWQFSGGRPYNVMENYLRYTFYRLVYEDKIAFSETHACFNTGLVDRWNNQIFAFFERIGRRWQPYRFLDFCVEGEGQFKLEFIKQFPRPPEQAHYADRFHHAVFDGRAEIKLQAVHVVDEGIERGRYPIDFLRRHMPSSLIGQGEPSNRDVDWLKKYVNALYVGDGVNCRKDILARIHQAKELARSRSRSNIKTAIPSYYPELDEVSLLLPLCLMNDSTPDVALVLRYINESASYGITVYSLEMAYINARLVNKPMSHWLNSSLQSRGAVDRDIELPVVPSE